MGLQINEGKGYVERWQIPETGEACWAAGVQTENDFIAWELATQHPTWAAALDAAIDATYTFDRLTHHREPTA